MIDSLLAIIDRIIKLLTIREKRHERIFLELWEPTFNDLLIVHRNYVEIFEKAKAMLGSLQAGKAGQEGSTTYMDKLAEISQYLSERRIEFEPVRSKLIALIDAVIVTDLDDISKPFVEALIAYFPTGTSRRVNTAAMETLSVIEGYRKSILDESNQPGPSHISREELFLYVHNLIQRHRQSWSLVCEAYATLRMAHAKRTYL